MLRVNSQTEPLLPDDALHYAPAPPRRYRVLRSATWWIFGLAVGTFAVVWAWRAANQIHYLWLQHQLMTYVVPDGPMRVGGNAEVRNATSWPAASRILPWPFNRSPFYPVFIHQRIAPSGASRLIVVEEYAESQPITRQLHLGAIAFE